MLVIPIVTLGVTRTFEELLGRHITNPGWEGNSFGLAQQRIKFRLDETGARLESDAAMALGAAFEELRSFEFDKPFLLYLHEQGTEAPYLAMWIETVEVLQPVSR